MQLLFALPAGFFRRTRTPGAYFVTICTANREKLFWSPAGPAATGGHRPPLRIELSDIGIKADNYCIMPDHIHFIIYIRMSENGQTKCAPTISRVIKQFKGSITKQAGRPIWQRSFYDHGIRNQQDYDEIWQYIENNPLKYALNRTP